MNSRKIISWIAENWPAKVLSIALALVLFIFHRMNTQTTRPISVPLTIETSATLLPASSYPTNVRVSLRGEDESIKSIAEGDIEAYVDFTRHENEGLYRAPVQIRKKGSALGIEPLEISVNPLEISVQLDRRISKTLPLTAVIRGRVANGFDMVSYSLSPTELVVMGPFASLEAVTEIQTEPIDLDGRTENFSVQVTIVNPNPLFAIRGRGMAEFSGVISPAVPVRNIEGIPIILTGLNPLFKADFGNKTGSVRFEGRQSQIDSFQPPSRFFIVDCSNISEPGTYVLPVNVELPRGFIMIRSDPEELEITVTLIDETDEVDF